MEEKIELQHLVCNCCGEDIGNDDYYEFNRSILCNLCFHSETVECSHCDDRIWADDNAGTDSMPLCNSCYDDYYTTCECCGRIIHRDYANYDDEDDYAYCSSSPSQISVISSPLFTQAPRTLNTLFAFAVPPSY